MAFDALEKDSVQIAESLLPPEPEKSGYHRCLPLNVFNLQTLTVFPPIFRPKLL